MSAIAKYIVKRPFEYEGAAMRIGEELVLDSREADQYYKKGLLTAETFLDPDNAKDAAKIKEVKDRLAVKKAALSGAAVQRQEARTEAESTKDDELSAKRAELKGKIPADAIDKAEQEKAIDSMSLAQLSRKEKDLEEKNATDDEEVEDAELKEKTGK